MVYVPFLTSCFTYDDVEISIASSLIIVINRVELSIADRFSPFLGFFKTLVLVISSYGLGIITRLIERITVVIAALCNTAFDVFISTMVFRNVVNSFIVITI